jgi:sigma-B regulation protein RsbU (phosphoserine phosphatase)
MNSTGMFVTVLYGILDPRTRLFHYARAGHDQPIVLTPEGQLRSLPFAEGQLLGVLDKPDLEKGTVPLPIGSTLIIFTDGVTEAANEAYELFGIERLQNAIRSHRHETASTLVSRLLDKLNAHRGACQQSDDITLLVLQSIP